MSNRSYVKVLTYTWSKDSHGLFDYESPHLFNSNFKITAQGQFFRTSNEIQMLENNTQDNDKLAYLFDVQQDPDNKDRYWLISKFGINSHYGLGLVVRGIKKKGLPTGYELQAGDHIKVGRVKFIVREIRDEEGNISKLHADQNLSHYEKPLQATPEGDNTNGVICRICLMDDTYPDPVDNTLVAPCKCKGSCEYVHLKCLRQWLDSKKFRVQNGSNVCLAFNYKKFSCEICKDNLPYSILLKGQEIEIVDIKKPEHLPYILLEKIESTRENRGLYMIRGSDEEVQIGRGHTNSILVSDISVSRNHASIVYKDGKFRLFDRNSKFGTLVQLNSPIEVSADKTIVQCGKTVIILSLQKEKLLEMVTIPKVVEPMEILESPGTPSTTNEYDADSKQLLTESEKPKKRGKRRLRKRETAEYNTQVEEPKEESICHVVVNGSEILETKLLLQSKKIFKIVKSETNKLKPKPTADEAEGSTAGRRKGKRRN